MEAKLAELIQRELDGAVSDAERESLERRVEHDVPALSASTALNARTAKVVASV